MTRTVRCLTYRCMEASPICCGLREFTKSRRREVYARNMPGNSRACSLQGSLMRPTARNELRSASFDREEYWCRLSDSNTRPRHYKIHAQSGPGYPSSAWFCANRLNVKSSTLVLTAGHSSPYKSATYLLACTQIRDPMVSEVTRHRHDQP